MHKKPEKTRGELIAEQKAKLAIARMEIERRKWQYLLSVPRS